MRNNGVLHGYHQTNGGALDFLVHSRYSVPVSDKRGPKLRVANIPINSGYGTTLSCLETAKQTVLSIIVPVYNNPYTLETLVKRIEKVPALENFLWHLLFVDDGSTDASRKVLISLAARYPRTGWIGLETNTGQQNALFCGLAAVRDLFPGDTNGWVVTMDDDLAHPPELLTQLLEQAASGFDLVYAVPKASGTGSIKSGSRIRDLFFRFCLGTPKETPRNLRIGSFRIFNRNLIDRLTEVRPTFPYLSAQFFALGQTRPLQLTHITYDPPALVSPQTGPASRYQPLTRFALFVRLMLNYAPVFKAFQKKVNPDAAKDQWITPSTGGGYSSLFRLHILGGSASQIAAIRRATDLGIKTVVSDKNPEAPGLALADFVSHASTFDSDGVAADAHTFASRAFLATGTDQPVLTAAKAAAKLGIPYFLTPTQAALVTNKREMKRAFVSFGIPTSPFRITDENFTTVDIEGLAFPLVIKPLDSQGQRGVFRVDSIDEIPPVFPVVLSFSREKVAIIEEYYPSGEITVSGWMESGVFCPLTTTDRVTVDNPPHIGVCLAHHYPSRFADREGEIRALTQKIITAFNLQTGPFYAQYLVGEKGIRVNEVACRLGGAYEDEFIPWITGVDILGTMIRRSCTLEYDTTVFDHVDEESRNKAVSLQMFFYSTGEIALQSGMDLVLAIPGIMNGKFLLAPGTRIREKENSTQRAGYFIVCAASPDEADRITCLAVSCLVAIDTHGKSMLSADTFMLMNRSLK